MESTCPITTTKEQPGKSQVRACLERIEQEDLSARRGLADYAEMSRHTFIPARMEGMQSSHEQLIKLVGSDEAIRLVAAHLEQVPEVSHA